MALGTLVALLAAVVLVSFVNHRIRLSQEAELFEPLGKLVTVGDASLSIHAEGNGSPTLVFMAGSGTASPILDFRSLYSQLSADHQIVVVERIGYGFSDISASPRDLDTVLQETRAALEAAGIEGPFVLLPHSMAYLEAASWSQSYPDEVAAIIGLDVALPEAYELMDVPGRALLELSWFGARIGITRFLPAIADDSAAIQAGGLSEPEKDIYRAVFYRRTMTRPMVREVENVRQNARVVDGLPAPQAPMLFFTSNGEGTGLDPALWQQIQGDYLAQVSDGRQVVLDSGHYVHNYDTATIALQSRQFLQELGLSSD